MNLNRSNFLTFIWLLLPVLYLIGSYIYQGGNQGRPPESGLTIPVSREPSPTDPAPAPGDTPVPAEMVFISKSRADTDDDRDPNQPGFYIDRYEVTVSQYVAFLNLLAEQMPDCRDYRCFQAAKVFAYEPKGLFFRQGQFYAQTGAENHPIMGVTWAMAETYCRSLQKRLPTDEEWLQAAQGPDGFLYPWGNGWDLTQASMLGDVRGGQVTLPVGSNADDVTVYGVHDMLGSANEWVQNWAVADYRPDSSFASPTGSNSDYPHINRGLYKHASEEGFLAKSVGPTPTAGLRCVYDP